MKLCYIEEKRQKLRGHGALAENLQRAKKVLTDSPGLVIFVLNLPDGQVLFFLGKLKLQKDCNQSC